MKRIPGKKLVLDKTTLRALTRHELGNAAGAGPISDTIRETIDLTRDLPSLIRCVESKLTRCPLTWTITSVAGCGEQG